MAHVNVSGFLGADAELRFTPGGKPVLNFSIADTPRRKNDSGEWEDAGPTNWWRVALWGADAEAEAERQRLVKGAKVTVVGTAYLGSFRNREGGDTPSLEFKHVDALGVAEPRGPQQVGRGGQRSGGRQQADPWATSGPDSFDQAPPF
ncbi:single-strand binding protein [Xylanimonas cellulosilytica DSM 15894]|uniref:Single-stranded DNA-binding protein n=1 Tax=Xylanimonas cellulosilytica (strain DSM 15894 / JCM 12276 / CECT 5975 / KCTC 9989 / LMG 20990 / NBRC 107835 / XIL07) TaxID=446471 RepID=D1BWP5_XYLCX|nr:single-stranded DNA-binding protein [Xylanimonas cellulosilytica]ACZ29627.1 single-strand binding protein [Xylanimonas cellulosilytica DSM 15894]